MRLVRRVVYFAVDEHEPSGSPARNAGNFETLVVTLIDGARILCTAAGFEVQVHQGERSQE